MISVNGADHDLAGRSVRVVLDSLDINGRGVAVAIDGEVVSKSRWESTTIEDGAIVEIVTAVAGG